MVIAIIATFTMTIFYCANAQLSRLKMRKCAVSDICTKRNK